MTFRWTDEAIERTAQHLAEGLSAAQIGERLGCSRSAVIGKVNRHEKLKAIGFKQQPAGRRRAVTARAAVLVVAKPKPAPTIRLVTPRPVAPVPVQPTDDVDALVQKWVKANGGPRQIEPGASGNPEHVKAYLRSHGWECSFRGHGHGTTAVLEKGRQRKRLKLNELWEFVDDLRIADGLEPFAPRQRRAA